MDRDLFMKLILENIVLLEKPRVPKYVIQKKEARKIVCDEYSQETGVFLPHHKMP